MKHKWQTYLSKAIRGTMAFAAVFLVLIAILVSLARVFTPFLNHYKQDFSKWANTFIERPTTIGKVSATFENFEPVFVFKNVSILYNAKRKQYIKIPSLSVGVDVLDSIIQRKFVTGYIVVTGIKLKAQILKDGKLYIHLDKALVSEQKIKGKKSAENNPLSQSTIWQWILTQHRLELRDFDIGWSRYKGEHFVLHNLDATLTNSGNKHQLRGHADIGHSLVSKISLGVDLKGSADNLKDLSGSLYFGARSLPIGSWFKKQAYQGLRLTSGRANLRIWADWKNQSIKDIQSRFKIVSAKVAVKKLAKPVAITLLKGDLLWTNQKDKAWSLVGRNIDFIINGHAWPKDKFYVWFDPGHKTQSVKVHYLDLKDTASMLLLSHRLPEATVNLIQQLKPHGEINNLDILHDGSIHDLKSRTQAEVLHHAYLKTSYDKLGMSHYKKFPGVDDLKGAITLVPNAGKITAAAENTVLNIPSVFPQPIAVSELQSEASWKFVQQHWQVYLTKLNFNNNVLDVAGQGRADVAKSLNASDLSLLFTVKEQDLSQLRNYLPSKTMAPDLNQWLTNAFVAGKRLSATLLYHGGLNSMPFKYHSGVFLADAKLDNMTLKYGPGWPVISGLDGLLVFRNNSMYFKSDTGEILGGTVKKIQASIPALVSKKGPMLTVTGELVGDSAVGLQFIHKSPLQKRLSGMKLLKLTGPMDLNLFLRIPLDDTSVGQRILGKVNLKNNTLTVPSQKLTMTDVSGLLTFNDIGAYAKNIKGSFFNYPAKVNINTVTSKQKTAITYVSISSHIKQKDLYQHFKLPLLSYLSGDTDYRALLRIQDKTNTSLQVSSGLQGMQLHLPAPYGKPKANKAPFKLKATFVSDSKTNLGISYNKMVNAALELNVSNNNTSLYGGQIVFGSGEAMFDNKPGLAILGFMKYVDIPTWKKFFASKKTDEKSNDKESESLKKLIRKIVLNINTLNTWDQPLTGVRLWLYPKPEAWQLKITSNNISGSLFYPDNPNKDYIKGDFSKLYFKKVPKKGSDNFDPSTLPMLNIKADDFLYNKVRLQGLHVKLRPITRYNEKGVIVSLLKLTSRDIQLSSKGSWIISGKHETTKLSGSAKLSDLGAVLKRWDVTNKFRSGSGDISFSLKWPAAPNNFSIEKVMGSVGFDLSDGRIVGLGKSTESKIGIGKMINALSVDSLLHLGDLGEDGYSYSSFKADMDIAKGKMNTENALFKGPVADVGIKGDVNFAKKFYDLHLRVEPHLTSSLPILAGVLINPVAGAIAWLADKVIISPSVDKIAGVNYTMIGPFKNPEIKKISKKSEKK